ncbi:hypothetical protein HNO88_000056 [Novosphingobium chloroacetimidivorans]|uniref:Uncharacterized protein n=1 Tax=Novosphingobium chloroacetimidivorans TaxID=1428314 RepID=A0A7W7NUZ4_9SPHN|nr:hypothetical protein [Novosphingobium chloroacetimidivorans]MBB4856759.1 hypothetical protein [Novosphingobium chloroacetimidivorans]
MRKFIAAALLASVSTGTVQAQSTYVWSAPPSAADGRVFKYYLPMGTPIMLRTRTQVNTREANLGDRVYLEVAEPITFQGQTVIPAGAPVVGEVASLQRNGHFGRKGKVAVRLIEVQTPSGPVRLSGDAYDEGTSGTVVSFGTIMLVSTLGFLIHGTSGNIAANSTVKAHLAENMNFRWQDPQARQASAAIEASPDQTPARAASLDRREVASQPSG